MKRILTIVLALMLVLSLAACGGNNVSGSDNSTPSTSNNKETSPSTAEPPVGEQSKEKTFGDIIKFDDLEIVLGNEIEWTAVKNQYSDKNGMEVFLVPVTIKNVKSETHGLNMFYYSQYGSKGTKLDSVGSYFDNEIGSAGSMRSGAVQESVMAFLYDGDGDYYVEFSKLSGGTIEVKLPIKWEDNSASPLSDTASKLESSDAPTSSANDYTFNDIIEFDDLEIVFGNEITWTAVKNQYSDKSGMDVFLVPVTIKNIKSETHGLNMFYYTQYGSKGTKLDSVGSYFDNEIGTAGDMRSGATQESVMAFLYDGDGDYYVEFSKLSGDTIEVRLPITK